MLKMKVFRSFCKKVFNSLPAHYHELSLRGPGSDPLPYIHGEQSAATVEYRGERGHECCHHYSDHQTSQTYNTITGIENVY